jgi:putative tryptophan/tyrosine transport system substrate-binding protein
MRRREFITLLGGAAAAWPSTAHAQTATMPVVGFLDPRSPDAISERLRGFRQGLKETGYSEGENVAIVYRFAENQADRLPEMAADLVRRQVAVIATAGEQVAVVAKAATTTVPIVFIASQDPVKLGFVASLSRPGGNMTGINFFSTELVTKRLEFLRALVPTVTRIAVLVNPSNPSSGEATVEDAQGAARVLGLQIHIHNAQTRQDIDTVFAALVYERADALLVASDTLFSGRRVQLVNLATRHGIPTAFPNREHTEIGGLMSYGSSIVDAWRQAGIHTGRILKGSRPADLPVVQASKFELVINHQTARMLGLAVPTSLLALADEVIE